MSHMDDSHCDSTNDLTPHDMDLLDRLVEVGLDPDALEGLSEDEQLRCHALQTVFHLLEDYPVNTDADEQQDDALIHAALARIRRAEESAAGRRRISHQQDERDSNRRRFRIPMPDLLSVAAIILIGVSVMWPIFGQIRNRAIDAGCVANLSALGSAFSNYAAAWDGRVPVVTAGWSGGSDAPMWIDPLPLVEQGYCEHDQINCPGHPATAIPGYSRQLMAKADSFRWLMNDGRPVMGDRNPVIDARRSASYEYVDPKMNSINHGKRGQNVLNLDTSVSWLEVPVVGSDDNIWLIRGEDSYHPGGVPDFDNDIYLVH